MTTFKIVVEDEQAGMLKKLLQEVSFIKSVEEEHGSNNEYAQGSQVLERVNKILDNAKGKNLFKDIADPSEWQREIRKEWDRDF